LTLLQLVIRAGKIRMETFGRRFRQVSKMLWLSFRIWRHNRQVRALKNKIEEQGFINPAERLQAVSLLRKNDRFKDASTRV
jgi:hypothetical protein